MRHLLYGPIPKMCCFKIWSMLTSPNLGFESLVTLVSIVSMKLPVFTKDLFETFRIGVKKMAGSAFCTPKMLKKKTSQPVDSSASPCSSRRSSAWVEPVEPVRNPVKTGDIPRSTCEKKETSWDIHIRCGLMKVWWGLHTRPTNHQWDLILHCFRLIFRYILGTRARQDFQAGEKGRSKTAWNADSKQKWGCQLPPTHLNCELAGKNGVVWGNESSRNGPSGPIRIIMSMDSCSDLCLKSINPEPTTHFWLYPIDCSNLIFGT